MADKSGFRPLLLVFVLFGCMMLAWGTATLRAHTYAFELKAALIVLQILFTIGIVCSLIAFIIAHFVRTFRSIPRVVKSVSSALKK